MNKSKEKITVTIDEYEAILQLKLPHQAVAISEANLMAFPVRRVLLEVVCPEWAIMRNKPLVRMLCQS